MNPNYYTLGSASPFVGKSLFQINQLGAQNAPGYEGIGFNPEDFAKYLGVGVNSPLTAGQQLNFAGGQQGDVNMISKIFTPQTAAERAALQAEQNNQFIIKQNQPAISALGSAITNTQGAYGSAVTQYQSEIPNIQNIYQDTINNLIKATNKEYASRGVPTTSFDAAQNRTQTILPAQNQEANAVNQFLNAIAGLQTGGATAVGNLQQILGGLQSGAPLESLQTSISQAQLPLQQAQSAAQVALLNAQAQAQGIQGKYVSIPGVGVLDTSTGKLITQFSSTSGAKILGLY